MEGQFSNTNVLNAMLKLVGCVISYHLEILLLKGMQLLLYLAVALCLVQKFVSALSVLNADISR